MIAEELKRLLARLNKTKVAHKTVKHHVTHVVHHTASRHSSSIMHLIIRSAIWHATGRIVYKLPFGIIIGLVVGAAVCAGIMFLLRRRQTEQDW